MMASKGLVEEKRIVYELLLAPILIFTAVEETYVSGQDTSIIVLFFLGFVCHFVSD